MNLIHCTSSCVYQDDGFCKLDNAAEAIKQINAGSGCLHFVDKNSEYNTNPSALMKSPHKPL